ncbi:MAG: universal stress protein [Bacteroidota bacterium]
MKTIKKILVPTDFSELSLASIDFAKSLASTYGARICLMHVVDDVPVLAYHTIDLTTNYRMDDALKGAEHELQRFAVDLLGDFTGTEIVSRRGNPYYEIVKLAEEGSFDLIVMATHGRTGLVHVVMGSVTEKVVQHSGIPVLTVKPVPMRKAIEHHENEIRDSSLTN